MVVVAEDRIQRRNEVRRYVVVADKLTPVPSADCDLAESSSGFESQNHHLSGPNLAWDKTFPGSLASPAATAI